jgi:formyltetrahydrofolate deformylase
MPVLRISCTDRTGLVHAITGVLVRHHLNIISNHEFVDKDSLQFFMRTEFDIPDESSVSHIGTYLHQQLTDELTYVLPEQAHITLSHSAPPRIMILVTKEYHCLGELLLRHTFGDMPAEICAVAGNYTTLQTLTEKFDLPYHCISHEGMTREEQEEQMMACIDRYAPDYLVLAKYMRVLSPGFVERYAHRIINIHHSFLPAFIGAQPYKQAYQRGVKIIGATAHFVTNDLDEGPIIAQSVIPVDHTHSAADMAQRGRDVEKTVLARALKLVLEERVFLCGNRVILFE